MFKTYTIFVRFTCTVYVYNLCYLCAICICTDLRLYIIYSNVDFRLISDDFRLISDDSDDFRRFRTFCNGRETAKEGKMLIRCGKISCGIRVSCLMSVHSRPHCSRRAADALRPTHRSDLCDHSPNRPHEADVVADALRLTMNRPFTQCRDVQTRRN